MEYIPSILAVAGSLREHSFSKRLVAIAARGAQQVGANTTVLDLRDHPIPLYDGDLEDRDGLPENVKRLKSLFMEHDGFLIASPDYCNSFSGVLKNLLDWVSRPVEGLPILECFTGKTAGILSTARGTVNICGELSGVRTLSQMRAVLSSMQVTVLPNQIVVPLNEEAFAEGEKLRDERVQCSIMSFGAELARALREQSSASRE